VAVDIEFGPVEVGYLRRRARPSIFVYDLATHGKVLWGPSDLLRSIPAFGPERIPREDALHLVFNRTIEQLEAYDRLDSLARAAPRRSPCCSRAGPARNRATGACASGRSWRCTRTARPCP